MQSRYLPFLDFIWRVVKLLDEISHQIEMAMLDRSQKTRIALFVLEGVVYFQDFYHVPYHLHISSSHCEMQGHFSFRFFEVIEQGHKRGEVLKNR